MGSLWALANGGVVITMYFMEWLGFSKEEEDKENSSTSPRNTHFHIAIHIKHRHFTPAIHGVIIANLPSVVWRSSVGVVYRLNPAHTTY